VRHDDCKSPLSYLHHDSISLSSIYLGERARATRRSQEPTAALQVVLRVLPPTPAQLSERVHFTTPKMTDFGSKVMHHLFKVSAPLLFSIPVAHGAGPPGERRKGTGSKVGGAMARGQEWLRLRRDQAAVVEALLRAFRAPATFSLDSTEEISRDGGRGKGGGGGGGGGGERGSVAG